MATVLTSPAEMGMIISQLQNGQIMWNYQAAPSALSATTNHKQYGLGVIFTPQALTRVKVHIFGGLVNSSTVLTNMYGSYGSGTVPTAGSVSPTGVTFSKLAQTFQVIAADEANVIPFFIEFYATSLAIGTTYWFDLMFSLGSATQTVTLTTVNTIIEEI